jgi:hypothetical protein
MPRRIIYSTDLQNSVSKIAKYRNQLKQKPYENLNNNIDMRMYLRKSNLPSNSKQSNECGKLPKIDIVNPA